MSNELEIAIKLKLQKAKSLFNEANVLLQNKFYATVINRLYYSCFHATKALLLTRDFTPKTHNGVVNLLHLHFVKTGLFDMEMASFYSRLLQERIEEDYNDFIVEDAETTENFIQMTKAYLTYIEKLIEKNK